MQLEVIRIVADWLQDEACGVNALIAGVPRDAGDAVPPAVTVYDSTRTGWVGRKTVPREGVTTPAIVVGSLTDLRIEGGVRDVRDAVVPIAIGYVVRNADTAEGSEAASYTMRAVRRSIACLLEGTSFEARSRNGIVVRSVGELREASVQDERGDVVITAALLLDVWAHDLQPLPELPPPVLAITAPLAGAAAGQRLVHRGGGWTYGYPAVRTVTASTAATAADETIRADCSSAAVTVTLPDPAAVTGAVFTVLKVDGTARVATVVADGGSLLGGYASVTLEDAGLGIRAQSNGTTYDLLP